MYLNPAARSWRSATPPSRDPLAFHRELAGYAPTPLRTLPDALAAQLGIGRVLVKDESNRLGLPAFKILGASWAVHRAAAGQQISGLAAATDGNHGRALARTGRLLGHPVRIFVPDGVHPAAVQAIRDEGAEVIVTGGDYDHAVAVAAAECEATGSLLVQDTSWPGYEEIPAWIVEGYSTMLWEIDVQVSAMGARADVVVIPVGVGSLAEAVVRHFRAPDLLDPPALLAVEPAAAAGLLASLTAGARTTVATSETIMTGLNCGTPSASAWPVLRDGLDAAVVVSDDQAAQALADLWSVGIDAGPCGAAALAALRAVAGDEQAAGALDLDSTSSVVLLATEGRGANPHVPHP